MYYLRSVLAVSLWPIVLIVLAHKELYAIVVAQNFGLHELAQ